MLASYLKNQEDTGFKIETMYMMVKKKSTSAEIDKKTSLDSNASKVSEVLLNSIIPLKLATDQSLKVI